MPRKPDTEPIEEVRILMPNAWICAAVSEAFVAEGVAAHGDYRDEADDVRIRDAFEDGVEYIVFMSIFDFLSTPDKRRKNVRDVMIKVYLRREDEVKIMPIGAAITMVQQRRLMP